MLDPFDEKTQCSSTDELIHYFQIEKASPQPIKKTNLPSPLNYSFCKKHKVLILRIDDGGYQIASSEPFKAELIQMLQLLLMKPVELCYCPEQLLLSWIDQTFHQQKSSTSKIITKLTLDAQSSEELQQYDLLDEKSSSAPSIKLLNSIIGEAITQKASDIHFEPVEDSLRVRYRIDGVLQNRHVIPSHYKPHLTSRLKLMAKLDIAESRRPQDGRLKLKMGTKEIDFRVSSIPIAQGERIVLRILDKNNLKLGFDHLGMNTSTLESFKDMIGRSEGIILVTGPTGSGKTTTLYSAVKEIYQDSINIMTIEDPIEYNLPGIAQIGVQPKIDLTFAKGLKHILRQDPDVILIGEIRDLETAQIAIQSSLTGHLVMSTLHTNDAPSAITRLVDMGIEPYLISSSLIGVLAQRLLRKICLSCKESYQPTWKDLTALSLDTSQEVTFFRGRGCKHCFETGYQGRVGIFEFMPLSSELKHLISQSAQSTHIKRQAIKEGMLTLKDQGKQLVTSGVTTIEEVLRVALGMEEV